MISEQKTINNTLSSSTASRNEEDKRLDFSDCDIQEILKRHPKHRGFFECPSCGGKLSINKNNGTKFSCYDCGDRAAIRKAVLKELGGGYSNPEKEAQKEAREQERREVEAARIAVLRTEEERDREWQGIVERSFLSDRHREEMRKRGWRDDWIEKSRARSSARGRAIPIFNATGLMVGSQVVLDEGGKIWYGAAGTNRLKETDELPLMVVYPEKPRTGVVALTESTLDKPCLCAQNWNIVTIGSSNIGSQPKDLKRSIATIKERMGWESVEFWLMADGGAVRNHHVIGCYRKLNHQIKELGGELKVAWWGQLKKENGDIDEIPLTTKIKLLTFDDFDRIATRELKKADDRKIFEQLSSLTLPITEQRNEEELSPISIPRKGNFTFISSGVATGKTKQLERLVGDWERIFPDAKILSLGYRNGLLKQQKTRLKISHIEELRVGYGLSNTAINHAQKLGLCLDSILEIDIDAIPPNTLIIFDEIEAILSHATLGGTLGGRMPEIQTHLVAICHRVLATGGALMGLEDTITNVSIKGLLDLTENKYPYEIISNSAERFNWDVSIAGGSKADFISLIISRLMAGERICLTTTSQRFGEILERIALDRIPDLKGKIERVDSKTISELKDSELLTQPSEYLRSVDVRLLILSPTVESGFSILDGDGSPLFDRVMAYFVNLDTRSHIQLLSRYRSNCPREIYALDRGAEANNNLSRNPEKLLEIHKQTANTTALAQGHGRIKNTAAGEIWNRLGAEFTARSALSSQYLREYLEIELRDRGHRVVETDWALTAAAVADVNDFELPDRDELKLDFANLVNELEAAEARELAQAESFSLSDGKPDVKKATAVLHSSNFTNRDRFRARKTILTDDLLGAELSPDFLLQAIVKRRGAYRRECELAWFLTKPPKLAKAIDREFFTAQLEKPHIIYRRVPKLAQRVDLLAPIAAMAHELASREYCEGDEVVEKFNQYLLTKGYQFYILFGLHINPETIDTKGRRRNTAINNVNKVMRKLGYQPEEARREGKRGEQKSIYMVTNTNCPHRQTIYQALEQKHKELSIQDERYIEVGITFNKEETNIKVIPTGTQTQYPSHPPSPPPSPPPSGYRVGDWIELGDEWVKVVAIGTQQREGVNP
jgi:predicted RNA-binding Zn-ribbon protein involved in translation (DUF1610 family)